MYLGIDIGGTTVKYGLVTADGEVRAKKEYPVAFDHYETPILQTVLQTSREFMEAHHTWPEHFELAGIGVSATGQIDSVHGVVAGVGGNIANWKGSQIRKTLEEAYHLPVTVLNDANCAILAEQWIGNARGCRHAMMITIGTGVGGGMIVDGQILQGASGFAGELGHFVMARDGRQCTCGNYGCYEQYASMTALIRMVREALPLSGAPQLTADKINGKLIFQLAEAGEPEIDRILKGWIHDIASGLISFAHLFNPEIILIGGAVSVQERLFIDKIREQIQAGAMENFTKNLRVERAALGNDAGLIGAVSYFIRQR